MLALTSTPFPFSFCPTHPLSERIPSVRFVHLSGDFSDYPGNALRNLAIDQVDTTHFLMLDADFTPSDELAEAFAQLPAALVRDPLAALVVPAFEYKVYECNSTHQCFKDHKGSLPHDVRSLKQCTEEGMCGVFYEIFAPETHESTDYERWWRAALAGDRTPYRVPCFGSLKYEPYVVLRRSGLQSPPPYDTRFTGYGKNKIQHLQHLRFLGYRFEVLPSAFLVHCPHRESKYKEEWMMDDEEFAGKKQGHQGRMNMLFDELVEQLESEHGPATVTPLCKKPPSLPPNG